jgi:predicted nucleic acid-binding protein
MYILDTNIINHIVEDKISILSLPTGKIYITDIQHDEIMNTKDAIKRTKLLNIVHLLPAGWLPTQTVLAGLSRVGNAVGDGEIFNKILNMLDKIKKRKSGANIHDALIAEVAILYNFVLITNDNNLKGIVISIGGRSQGCT